MACLQSGVNIRVYVNGLEVKTLQESSDDPNVEQESLHGAGPNPLAVIEGRRSFSGSFKMLAHELKTTFPPLGDPNLIRNAIVVFVSQAADAGANEPTTSVTFGGVCFNYAKRSTTTDANMIEVDIPFVATTRVVA